MTTPIARPGALATGLAFLLAIGLTQWAQRRSDPAAEPGVRVAAVLLLEADARIDAAPVADAGQRAERAALVRRTWADQEQRARLSAADRAARAGPGDREVRFVLTRWQDVAASPHRARAGLVGRVEQRTGDGPWQAGPERLWRLELSRQDPVGRTRGWRLVSLG